VKAVHEHNGGDLSEKPTVAYVHSSLCYTSRLSLQAEHLVQIIFSMRPDLCLLSDVHTCCSGQSALQATLEHEGGHLSEKLTLAYAHSLMPYPTTWHVAAAYLAWCPCHGAEAMEQLLSQMPLTQVSAALMNAVCACHSN